jgi:hypothetical protein
MRLAAGTLRLAPNYPTTIPFNCVLLSILLSGCVSLVKISYPPEAVIHPTFDQPYTIWRRERVQVEWTPSLHAASSKYLARYDQVHRKSRYRQGTNSTDGIVDYESSHLEGAESEKIVPAGHNLIANPATVAEIHTGGKSQKEIRKWPPGPIA